MNKSINNQQMAQEDNEQLAQEDDVQMALEGGDQIWEGFS